MSKELAIQQAERFSLSGLNLELDNFINADKERIRTIAANAANSVLDGDADAIDALIFVKKGSELFKELDSKIRPIAEGKPIDKEYSKFGVKITEGMTGVKYDFTNCGDDIWNSLSAEVEKGKELLKERETFLKSITKKLTIVDEETGDITEIQPPVKSGKLGFTLTIK